MESDANQLKLNQIRADLMRIRWDRCNFMRHVFEYYNKDKILILILFSFRK